MKLYHGTSARLLKSALKHGLRPRLHADSNWEKNPSHPQMVYLSTCLPVLLRVFESQRHEIGRVRGRW
jgi:hypothetical protein